MEFKSDKPDQEKEIFKSKAEKIYSEASSLEYRNSKIEYIALSFYQEINPSVDDFLEVLQKETRFRSRINDLLGESANPEEVDIVVRSLHDTYVSKGLIGFVRSMEKYKKADEVSRSREYAGIIHYDFFLEGEDQKEFVFAIHFEKQEREIQEPPRPGIRESLEILVDTIVESKMLPSRIQAISWLMDVDALRGRMDFQKQEEYDFDGMAMDTSPSTWGQFIDESGQVKQKEIEYLYEHKKPRYKKVKATITIADLFKKYGKNISDKN